MEAPGAAAANAHFACWNCNSRTTRQCYFSSARQDNGGAVVWRAYIVALIAILRPFFDISVNVVKAKRVGLKGANVNRMLLARFPAKISGIRIGSRLCSGQRAARRVRCRSASSRGILPFGFGEQPIGLACLARQPRDVLPRDVIPGYVDHGPSGASASVVGRRMRAAFVCYARIPLCKRYLEPARCERLGNRHPTLWAFIRHLIP